MGRKKCYLDLLLHRLKCNECGKLWWPTPGFLDGKHRYARSFALTVLDLLSFGTISSVAHYLGVGWDLIKEIHKSKLSRTYRSIPLENLNSMGIDEFSIKKGHEYMTIFTDLESGRIVHAVEGRSKEAIQPFLEKLGKQAKNLNPVRCGAPIIRSKDVSADTGAAEFDRLIGQTSKHCMVRWRLFHVGCFQEAPGSGIFESAAVIEFVEYTHQHDASPEHP